jgi:hypothetical protein
MAKSKKKAKKQPKIFNIRYYFLKTLVRILHANINIKGGNIFQREVYLEIKNSNKHKEVYEEFRIPLRKPKKKRKHHHVDILIVEDDSVLAINSKGKSFNNTKSEDSELDEYNWYKESLSKNFPGKEVNYIVFKDEYDENDSKMNTYHYLNENGISVYNTEEYMVKNYNIDFDALEKRRQDECVRLAEEELISDGFTLEQIYAACPKIETIN